MKVPHNSRKKHVKQAKNGLNTAPNAVIVVPKYPNCCTPLINVNRRQPRPHTAAGLILYKTGRERIGTIYILRLYAHILQSMDDVSAGKLASNICAYEFEDREPDGEMTDKENFYYALSQSRHFA